MSHAVTAVNEVTPISAAWRRGRRFVTTGHEARAQGDACARGSAFQSVHTADGMATETENRGTRMHIEEGTTVFRPMPTASRVIKFARAALGLRFEMRFAWEADWWPIDVQEVADTLAGYHDNLPGCLADLRDGKEVASGLAYFRVRP